MLECSPVIVDPNGHYLSIHKYVVDPDGTVHGHPGEMSSVKCPVPGCGWHEFVKLEGWGKMLQNAINCSKECETGHG